jgi:voltage-gated potassium channel
MLYFHLVRQYRRIRKKKSIGIAAVLCLLTLSIMGNATCFYLFERGADQDLGFGDALWYSAISITTIGYGDFYPSSVGGRLGTIFFIILVGLGTFTVFLGMVIDWVTDLALREKRGMSNVTATGHILIVNFPSAARVQQLIRELQSDPRHANREIVIINDSIAELPFESDDVLFVRGSVLEPETYRRASIATAQMAIVLATSYEDPNSDAVVAATVAVIEGLRSGVHTVAECLNDQHMVLFKSVRCDAIVLTMKLSGNLLAQEVHDPGVSLLVDTITSNVKGTTLFSTEIPESDPSLSYNELAKKLLDSDINLISVARDNESLTSFVSLYPKAKDRVIYAARQRFTWADLLSAAESSS